MQSKKEYNILVIEDNEGDFVLVEEYIAEQIEYFNLVPAKSFQEAKEKYHTRVKDFDVILLDLSLPDKTGLPLIEGIVSMGVNTPVIVLTGYADFEFGVKSLSLGVSDYILKDELTSLLLFKSIIYSTERKRISTALEESENQLRNFAKQLNNLVEEERSRIAREIHDEFGQQLTGLKMSLSSLKRFTGVQSESESIIDLMVLDVNNSIQSLRRIANELRPVILDKLGLFEAIEWLTKEFKIKTGIPCHLNTDKNEYVIDKAHEINIFRICQEALTNIAKHANATLVDIIIKKHNGHLLIKIVDNGKGIELIPGQYPFSMGLLNMKERASMIGAEFKISSSLNKGTSIELIINLD